MYILEATWKIESLSKEKQKRYKEKSNENFRTEKHNKQK